MQNAIWIISFLGVLIAYLHRPKWGAIALLIATMLVPFGSFNLGGPKLVRVELLLTPIIVCFQILGIPKTGQNLQLSPVTLIYLTWVSWVGLVSLLGGADINFIGLYGYSRFVAILFVFANIPWSDDDVQRIQLLCVFTAIPIAILCFGQFYGVGGARELTEAAFSPASASVIESQRDSEASGYAYRGLGVFGNVSPTGSYFLVTMTLAVLLRGTSIRNTLLGRSVLFGGLIASMVGGATTISGTFLGGFVPAVLLILGFSAPGNRTRILRNVLVLLALAAIGVQVARSVSDTVDAHLQYQWLKVVGGGGLTDRYSQDGVLAQAQEDFWNNPWLGVGVPVSDTFVGDSLFITILYLGGVVGALIFAVGMFALMRTASRGGIAGRMAMMWTIMMLVTGIGCTSIFAGRLGDWWWAIQGMLLSQYGQRRRIVSSMVRSLPAQVRPVRSFGEQPVPGRNRDAVGAEKTRSRSFKVDRRSPPR